MGEETKSTDGGINNPTETEGNTTIKSDSSTTNTTNEGKRKRGRPSNSTSSSEEKLDSENMGGQLNPPEIIEVEVPETIKKVGRPKGTTTAPKKTNTSDVELNEKDLAQMLQGVFGLMALPLGEHWNVSEAEAMNVASPLSRILGRMGAGKTVSKYSDGFLLMMATTSLVLPRTLLTIQERKLKLQRKEGVSIGINKERENKPTVGSSYNESAKPAGGDVSSYLKEVDRQMF